MIIHRLTGITLALFITSITSCSGISTETAPAGEPAPSPVSSAAYSKSASSTRGSSVADSSKPVDSGSRHHSPQAGILTAGEIDDNLNPVAFERYTKNVSDKLKQFPNIIQGNRIHLQVVDATGRGVSNARLKIGRKIFTTRTDGHFYFYPSYEISRLSKSPFLSVSLLSNNAQNHQPLKISKINLKEKGLQKISLSGEQNILPKALDLMFVIDTTGSMGDELRYIKSELKSIIKRVKRLHPETSIRYGLTVYRDKGDQYIVRSYAFQNSLVKMEALLAEQQANGGGDYPEAMDAALEKAVRANWGDGNRARMIFLIADAPPHSEGINKALAAAKVAHQKGIRIYPVGASGAADKAEYVMRHMALITNGRYQFLTDDSGVGNTHQEPHVACYVVTRLDQLITRTISSELSGRRVEPSKAEIIRQVGDYDNGFCKLTQAVHQTN